MKKATQGLILPLITAAGAVAVQEYSMVIALFALSLVMILGGIAAVTQGFPYVRLESGQVLVTGGTTTASAGVVLFGLAVLLMEARRLIGSVLQRAEYEIAKPGHDPTPGSGVPSFADGHSFVPPSGAAAGSTGMMLSTTDKTAEQRHPAVERDLDSAVKAEKTSIGAYISTGPHPAAQTSLADPTPADDDLFIQSEDRLAVHSELGGEARLSPSVEPDSSKDDLALRPALEEAHDTPASEATSPSHGSGDQVPEIPAEEGGTPKTEEAQVVGTYTSGANTYVMFANGTIQADTPRGRFTFRSLDELKAFVDSGGESPARGVA